MESTGIVRRIDDLGRVVIPKEIRRRLGVREGDPLEIRVSGDVIVLIKYEAKGRCFCCGSYHLEVFGLPGNQALCQTCTEKVVQAAGRGGVVYVGD